MKVEILLKDPANRPFSIDMNNAAYFLRTTDLATVAGKCHSIDANEELPESLVEAIRAGKLELVQVISGVEKVICSS